MICFYEFKHWDEGIYYLAYGYYYYDELRLREAIPTILTKDPIPYPVLNVKEEKINKTLRITIFKYFFLEEIPAKNVIYFYVSPYACLDRLSTSTLISVWWDSVAL